MEMEIDKLINEYKNTSQRINNIRVTELSLVQELINVIKKQQEEYEELKKAHRPIIGPAEIKKRIEELQSEQEALKAELNLKNTAIVALQEKLNRGPTTMVNPDSLNKKKFSLFKRTTK